MGRFDVFDGPIMLASDMTLDAAFCLIKGYVSMHFNRTVNLIIKTTGMPFQKEESGREGARE